MTPPGIEPATFRFVAQYLYHCATAVPFEFEMAVEKLEGYKLTDIAQNPGEVSRQGLNSTNFHQ